MIRVLVVLMAGWVAGCSDPEIERPGTWKPTGINDRNLRAMLANPPDAYSGTGAITSRGDSGSRAASRLLTDRRRPLLDAAASHVGSTSSGSADSAPGPSGPSGSPQ